MKDNINEFENRYPSKDFNKTVYAFDSAELRKLTSLDTIAQLGQMAQLAVNQLIQGECLPRVEKKQSQDIGVLYDIPKGQFIVFVPKVWCISCKNRRATMQYKGYYYCDNCLKLQQEADKGKEVLKAKKKK